MGLLGEVDHVWDSTKDGKPIAGRVVPFSEEASCADCIDLRIQLAAITNNLESVLHELDDLKKHDYTISPLTEREKAMQAELQVLRMQVDRAQGAYNELMASISTQRPVPPQVERGRVLRSRRRQLPRQVGDRHPTNECLVDEESIGVTD